VATGSKAKPRRGTMATFSKASDKAKKTGGSTIVSTCKACSNGGSGENKYPNGTPHLESSVGIA